MTGIVPGIGTEFAVGAVAYGAAVNLATDVTTPLVFTTIVYDSSEFMIASDTDSFVCQLAGWYSMQYVVTWGDDAPAAGSRLLFADIRIDPTFPPQRQTVDGRPGVNVAGLQTVSTACQSILYEAGDIVQFAARQTSGGDLLAVPRLQMAYMGRAA